MIGIEKEIDDLGRIVIPKAYRDCLGLEQGDKVTLLLSDLNIVISASKSFCAL